MYSMTASVAGLWLSSLKTQDAHARETGFLAAEAFANTAALGGAYAVYRVNGAKPVGEKSPPVILFWFKIVTLIAWEPRGNK
jgi:hypothetical protein